MGDLSFPPPLTVLPVTVGDTRDSTGRLRHLRAWTARPGGASVAGVSRRVSKRRGGRCLCLSPAPPGARRQPPAAAGGRRGSRSHRRRNSCGSARGLGVRQGRAGELGARGVAHGPDTGKPGTEGDGEAGLRGHVRGHVWGHLRGQLRGHLRGHVREHVQGALRSLRGPEPGQVTGSGCCRPAWPVIWERGTQGRGRASSVLCRRTEPQKELGTAGPLPLSSAPNPAQAPPPAERTLTQARKGICGDEALGGTDGRGHEPPHVRALRGPRPSAARGPRGPGQPRLAGGRPAGSPRPCPGRGGRGHPAAQPRRSPRPAGLRRSVKRARFSKNTLFSLITDPRHAPRMCRRCQRGPCAQTPARA